MPSTPLPLNPSTKVSKYKGRKKGSKNKNLCLHAFIKEAEEREVFIRTLLEEIQTLKDQISTNFQPILNPITLLDSSDFALQNEPLFDFFSQTSIEQIPVETSKF